MCGICGTIGLDPKLDGEAVVRRMLAAIVHRGPDEEAFLDATPVVLGSRRLSIIDLAGGSPPIWKEAGALAVVYNGEIYNFRELRQQLLGLGHSFRTNSDTEVIVHAYEQWGEACAAKLLGMFALAMAAMPHRPARRRFSGARPTGNKTVVLRKIRKFVFVFVRGARAAGQRTCCAATRCGIRLGLLAFRFGVRTDDYGRGRVLAAARLLDDDSRGRTSGGRCTQTFLEFRRRLQIFVEPARRLQRCVVRQTICCRSRGSLLAGRFRS